MKIYIEKFNRFAGLLLADFIVSDDFLKFCKSIDQAFNPSDDRTMLYIEGLRFISGIYPKEGCVYNLPNELISEINWVREPKGELEGSDIIAFRSKSNIELPSFFSNALKRVDWTTAQSSWKGDPCGGSELFGDINVVVKNVGQGNWNEIYSNNKCRIIYDLGASIHFSKLEVKKVIQSTNAFFDRPSLIISHWDVDHYKAIFQIEDTLLKQLCCVFCPSKLPNLTSKRAFKILQNSCWCINAISPSNLRIVKRRVSLELMIRNSNFSLFRGEKSSDRNKSGLSIAIWSKKEAVIMAGDHYYSQIFDDIYKSIPVGMKLNIVTPHHGGEAGKLDSYVGRIPRVNKAVTSTGKNSYGHPREKNRKTLAKMGFTYFRTDYAGKDIVIPLS
ncbi:hypothetical protein ACIROD_15875 [Peribacillus sp. NPDC101481]|uniref:hypothetical protein n=1 Tax=Peribacillus sp. NPDC101481 TaxID=3364403 RepID=UPI0038242C59